MKYIDIHAHLYYSDFDEDREKVIKRTIDNEMIVINIGTNLETSREVVALAEEQECFYAAVGIHPTEAHKIKNIEDTLFKIKSLAENKKVVCIGECGLDYFHIEGGPREYKEIQKNIFRRQIELAFELDLPLMIHCRDAYQDVIDILKDYRERTADSENELFGKKLRGNVHFFAGSVEDINQFLALDFTISYTGVATFAPQYRELIEATPLDKIHAETDSPFVAPVPFRGKRNEPLYTLEVIKKIAEIKKVDFDDLVVQLQKNATELFGIAF